MMFLDVMFRRCGPLLWAAVLLGSSAWAQETAAPSVKLPSPQVMRWVQGPGTSGHLDTAILHFVRGRQKVDLIGAIHIADKAYYRQLQKRFASYDRLLFELVKPEELDMRTFGRPQGGLSGVQRWIKDLLDVDFQLDEIDYSRPNFLHADIASEVLGAQLRAHAGDLLGSLLAFSITDAARLRHADGTARLGTIELMQALAAPDRPRALKRFLGRELTEFDLGSEEFGGFGFGSLLIGDRNAVAIRVLQGELAKGRKKLAIFYGAAHLPDMAARLTKLGFVAAGQDWLTAWDLAAAQR